ncbi:uncharacterized protein LOC144173203 [Haemaphysalis longicornis]
MFGAVNQQPAAGIFGSPAASFGQPRPPFGSFASTTPAAGTSLFGQPQSTGLLDRTLAANTSLFGTSAFGTATVTSGTTIKFRPPIGTDTIMNNGVSSTISTSHQCITTMREYENKSLEELRLEDYAANRKGSGRAITGDLGATGQQGPTTSLPAVLQPGFNSGAVQNTLAFGTSSTCSMAPCIYVVYACPHALPSQPAFGASSGFGPSTGPGTSTSLSSGTGFGASTSVGPSTSFGLSTAPGTGFSSTGFGSSTGLGTSTGFGMTETLELGQPQQKSVFSQPTKTGLFSATAATTQGFHGFGTTFGSTTQVR